MAKRLRPDKQSFLGHEPRLHKLFQESYKPSKNELNKEKALKEIRKK